MRWVGAPTTSVDGWTGWRGIDGRVRLPVQPFRSPGLPLESQVADAIRNVGLQCDVPKSEPGYGASRGFGGPSDMSAGGLAFDAAIGLQSLMRSNWELNTDATCDKRV